MVVVVTMTMMFLILDSIRSVSRIDIVRDTVRG
jgi:hypothetical protein